MGHVAKNQNGWFHFDVGLLLGAAHNVAYGCVIWRQPPFPIYLSLLG